MPKAVWILLLLITLPSYYLLSGQDENSKNVLKSKVSKEEIKSELQAQEVPAFVVVTKFDPIIEQNGSSISFSLDTDLPNNTTIMVGIERIYTIKNSDEIRLIQYFSKRKKVKELKTPETIILNHKKWKKELNDRKDLFMRIGEPFDVDKIEDQVEVSFVLPVNQDNPAFGKFNKNLIGDIVENDERLKIIRKEKRYNIPLDSKAVQKLSERSSNLHASGLETGTLYQNNKNLYFYTNYVAGDILQTSQSRKTLPKNSFFKVLNKSNENDVIWYKVKLSDNAGETFKTGWVNSEHLQWQQLKVYKLSSLKLSETKRTKQLKEEIQPWQPISVKENGNIISVQMNHSKITPQIYSAVLKIGICNAVSAWKTISLQGIEKIIIVNKQKSEGFIFIGGKNECDIAASNVGSDIGSIFEDKTKSCNNDCYQ